MGASVSQEDASVEPEPAKELAAASSTSLRAESPRPQTPPHLGVAGASFANEAPTSFVWSHGGNVVFVTGSWDEWRSKVPMTRTGAEFAAVLSVPIGTHQYKFIVDGNWRHSPVRRTERDEHGNLNNVLEVKRHVPEYDSNDPPEGIPRPPSPIESYNNSLPPHDDYSVEPPAQPPLFKVAPLNEPSSEESTRTIRHVFLNHLLVAVPESESEEVRTLATIQRYKDNKFITTIMVTDCGAPASRRRPIEGHV